MDDSYTRSELGQTLCLLLGKIYLNGQQLYISLPLFITIMDSDTIEDKLDKNFFILVINMESRKNLLSLGAILPITVQWSRG